MKSQLILANFLATDLDPTKKLVNSPSLIPFFEIGPTNTTPFAPAIGYANTQNRQAQVNTRRDAFPYGPDIITDGLGGLPYPDIVNSADAKAFADLQFDRIEDFFKLYEGDWVTSLPDGPFPGVIENGTDDLTFSMERLSIQPFTVRRLPAFETPAFEVDDSIVQKLTGSTQEELLKDHRLFYVDYRDQGSLNLTAGRFAAACDAFFYIHSKSGNFLPLAIRPNAGSELIYTPLDSTYDWLYAKMLFNQNDLWFGQFFHLLYTHEVIDATYLASLRTMSNAHPIFNILSRLGLQNFAIRQSALRNLINPGGPVDRVFAWTGAEAGRYSVNLFKKGATSWSSHYFEPELRSRGLIDSPGPALKHLPFYTDGKRIVEPIRTFMRSFVRSYYLSDNALLQDEELQNWIAECSGPAQVQLFPKSLTRRDELVEILTHYAYLASVAHGVLNTNDLSLAQLVVPWHNTAFYQPLPKKKGMTEKDVLAALPTVGQAIGSIQLAAAFGRPSFADGDRTTMEMFEDELRLKRYNGVVQKAAGKFREEMAAFSEEVRGRQFDRDGLSDGMPFIWRCLDPKVLPFYVAI
ncbi:lipoxygenase [Elsinoe ampelina]|uniref:Manganese lipoxygenase n=1 Tax=Elsinoe ampelina TaxID=302913 RepID=A0A6A6G7G2_9PEZI|nr:lipoxygenase [Elsinoe ampelina]